MTFQAARQMLSRRSLFLTALALLIAPFIAVGSASAQYSLCNKTSYALSAAIGYSDEGVLLTRGWWRLRPGECKRVLSEPVQRSRYFVYAEAIKGHQGELRTWSGRTPLCVQNDSLFTLRDQDECGDDPRRQRNFLALDIEDEGDGTYTTEFTDEENFSTFDAEVAGIQRLLKDIGAYTGQIDGQLGGNTRSAITRYQTSKGLPKTGAVSDSLVDTLITEANAIEEAQGFEMCNTTMLPVWAAFAQPGGDDDSYLSSGWWRLEAQECAKVRRGALEDGIYYVYGVMEAESRSVPLAGGDTEFCISDVQFETASDTPCEEQGFERASFRGIQISSQKRARFEFTPERFNPELAGR